MAGKKFYALHFKDNQVQWEKFDGQSLKPSEPPEARSSWPVIALLPDEYFFFFLPEGLSAKGARNLKTATMLRMQHFFPAPADNRECGVLPFGPAGMPGYFTHPGLSDFRERHEKTLEQASVVTAKFVLAWTAAQSKELSSWTYGNGPGPKALFLDGRLHFIGGAGGEYEKRLKEATDNGPPPALDWRESLAEIGRLGLKWSGLRLPLKQFSLASGDIRPWVVSFIAVTVIASLLFFSQARHYFAESGVEAQWENALNGMYAKVLGPNHGPDPYGKLISRYDRLKGKQTRSIDVVQLLAHLSAAAPKGLDVESLSLNPSEGTVRGKINSFDALEKYLKDLKARGGPKFTLEQATNTKDGVVFSLKVDLLQ